ncbi:hypothetical protein [Rhizobium sp. X9]|uniref:hypothetical protein n=1 Tax=Rhizobium sp. X9 TaxID=2815360 RepID=UPI001C0DB28B|nr:hypothetical protein [Rhizobium sp. X9]
MTDMSKSKRKSAAAAPSVRPKVEPYAVKPDQSSKLITVAFNEYSRSICGLLLHKN